MCFSDNIKFVVSAFNIIFILIGGALLSIGIIYKLSFDQLFQAIPESYNYLELIPILTVIVGVALLNTALFGFIIISFERFQRFRLNTIFCVIILLIFTFQVCIGIFALIQTKDGDDLSKSIINTTDTLFNKNEHGDLINSIQISLKCCGTYGPTFWNQTLNKPFPEACCSDKICSNVYTTGCQSSILKFLLSSCTITGITLLAFSLIEVIGTISVCYLTTNKRIRKRNYGYRLTEEDD
ncbi:tetraspanin-36-like [Tribolium madens]|uniref:tetraspanin-36-like n=1 Tax=Tribolium madens TaxID=41895 RepID=UPI001CF74AB9|nr:tetraspanin-36-like [Tribolium madens]